MTIQPRQMLVSKDKYSIKCPYDMTAEFITLHNTFNDASADAEVKYMISNNDEVSFHFAVDDKEVVQGIDVNRNSWNAGDGGKGTGNRSSISVEVCYSKSGGDRYKKAEILAIQFIAQLLHERNWGVDKVKPHQYWSGKHCPHRILDEGRLNDVMKAIDAELKKLNTPIVQQIVDQHQTQQSKPTPTPAPKVNPIKKIIQKIIPKKQQLTYTRVLNTGMSGDDVKALQDALNTLKFNCGTADGKFGNSTEDAVTRFQKVYLPYNVDGIAGQQTINEINKHL